MNKMGAEKDTTPQPSNQESEQDDENSQKGRQLRGLPWIVVVLSILTSTFLFGLDNTITADVQPAIVSRFGSLDKLAWLSVPLLASAASTTLFWSVDTA
jgi:hypothetical protein